MSEFERKRHDKDIQDFKEDHLEVAEQDSHAQIMKKYIEWSLNADKPHHQEVAFRQDAWDAHQAAGKGAAAV